MDFQSSYQSATYSGILWILGIQKRLLKIFRILVCYLHCSEHFLLETFRRSAEEWKNRFYIVFEGEEGQDAGGLLREW